MIEDVIRFYDTSGDLEKFSEHWEEDNYATRSNKIVDDIVRLTGFPPSPNMKYIREGVFDIKSSTTMEELRFLATQIKGLCVIDCFQISIDRENNKCHMLFDWYDRNHTKSYHLYKAKQISLSVLILRVLDISMSLLSDVWVVHYMTQIYMENPDIAEKCQDAVNHSKYRKLTHQFLSLALLHARKKCQDQINNKSCKFKRKL